MGASSIGGIKAGFTGLVTGVRGYRLIHFLRGTSAFQVVLEGFFQLGTLRNPLLFIHKEFKATAFTYLGGAVKEMGREGREEREKEGVRKLGRKVNRQTLSKYHHVRDMALSFT